ncbi:aspartic peptidase domain-containing protein, partial [Phakopsora pachyrhizi]
SVLNLPALYTKPSSSFQQQLGLAISRYSLFPFLNKNDSLPDLLPYVRQNLPKVLACSVEKARKDFGKKKPMKFKKRLLNIFTSGILGSATKIIEDVTQLGNFMLNGLQEGNLPGKNYILRDSAWGTSIVKTNGLKGDTAWSTEIYFGSDSQPLRMNIDSGSSDLFLFDPGCRNCEFKNHSSFNHHNSITFKVIHNSNFSSSYADGSIVDGYLARDTVSLNGNIFINKQILGMATKASEHWKRMAVDGLVGIGPDSLTTFNVSGNRGLFTQMIANNQLKEPVVGIALVKESFGNSNSGTFSFGAIDERWILPGELLTWRNVTSRNFWGVDLSGIYVNRKNLMTSVDPPRAIIDTGTSLTLVTEALATKIHSLIPGAQVDPSSGVWLVPCSIRGPHGNKQSREVKGTSITQQTIPKSIFFEFGKGKEKFGIPTADLAYEVVKNYSDNGIEMCYSGIQMGGDNFVILGDLFLKNNYVALKYEEKGKKSVGFANRTDIGPME